MLLQLAHAAPFRWQILHRFVEETKKNGGFSSKMQAEKNTQQNSHTHTQHTDVASTNDTRRTTLLAGEYPAEPYCRYLLCLRKCFVVFCCSCELIFDLKHFNGFFNSGCFVINLRDSATVFEQIINRTESTECAFMPT